MYQDARNSSSKRFCKPNHMMLIQSDIKYAPNLPIGRFGAKVQTYLSSAIDDHSRYLLSSRFYDNQEEAIIEDTFHQVISRYGTFDACYFDNGTQYIAKQIRFSLARLGIRVMYAKPRSGKSKGKIEKFHQVVDIFIRESKLKNIRTLEELNRLWAIYLDEYYHKKKHDGIANTMKALVLPFRKKGLRRFRNGTGTDGQWLFWIQPVWPKKHSCIMNNVRLIMVHVSASVGKGMKQPRID